jgi:hypothetical protein
LSSTLPESAGAIDRVRKARADGDATSFVEVEPGAYAGRAHPLPGPFLRGRINLITYRPELVDQALPAPRLGLGPKPR